MSDRHTSRRRFLGTSALTAAAIASRPLHALAVEPEVPHFPTADSAWRTTWDAALTVLAGNLKTVPYYPDPLLFEGSTYQGIWQECGPHEALVYATLNRFVTPGRITPLQAARNNHMAFFDLQKPDGQIT